MTKPNLSKSQYMRGRQCMKRLWLSKHRAELGDDLDLSKFEEGNEAGLLARECYLGGVLIKETVIENAALETLSYVQEDKDVIFEATAVNREDGAYARIDILKKHESGQGWDLIEVKSSTEVKEEHIEDVAFQYHAFKGAGYEIKRCYLMYIDNCYVRGEALEPSKLFKLENITEEAIREQSIVEPRVPHFITFLERPEQPKQDIGALCSKPYDCEFKTSCWKHVPEYSIFNVFPKAKAEEVFRLTQDYDVKSLSQDLYPEGNKLVDVESYIKGKNHIDKNQIQEFLSKVTYPVYYLDYETVNSAVPLYEGARPYQQVPFQYSLHVEDKEDGSSVSHHEYIHQETSDPRRALAESLVKNCGESGTVVAYNASFEQRVNKDLAEAFPDLAEALLSINDRMVDLMVPFRSRMIYSPKQKGSYSIKYVLPAFVPELSYDGMDIANGGKAMEQYKQFAKGNIVDQKQQEKLWRALSKYCELDTYAMVKLMKTLRVIPEELG